MISPRRIFLLVFLLIIPAISFGQAVENTDPDSESDEFADNYLFGNTLGQRERLAEKGIKFDSILTLDTISNISGGMKERTAFLGNYDITLTADLEKLSGLKGGKLFFYGLGNFGEQPSNYVGDLQTLDNIQAPETFKLYEAWYDQSFFDDSLSVLVGLHDYNSEFNTLMYASSLLNSSFGVQVDISQVGPSIFPTTALALRLKLQNDNGYYVQAAVFDGIPGSSTNPRGTHINLSQSDGLYYAGEVGVVGNEGAGYGKAAIGAWHRTTDFEDFAGRMQSSNSGLYAIAEKRIFTEENENEGLGAFIQYGIAEGDRNVIGKYLGLGLAYTGAIPCRDEDVISFGMANAINSDRYYAFSENAYHSETALELNYRAIIRSWLAVTADVQRIIHPSMDSSIDSATVLGMRVEIAM